MDEREIHSYLQHLARIYDELKGEPLEVSICGGAALNLLGYVRRATKDIDIVSPEILPAAFTEAVGITAAYFGLKPDWINQGPIDLMKMGLPEGFYSRCERLDLHSHLVMLIASRFDQIHFKLYASVDRGGYHLQDLKALHPTDEELATAAAWCLTHDVSEPFRDIMRDLLVNNGWEDVAHNVLP